jgi:ABC-type amino acid transport system permease subunit
MIAMAFSLACGLLPALARLSAFKPLAVLVGAWIDVFRNLPLIFVILYLFLGLPAPWREAYEDVVPGFFPEALQSGRVLAALLGLVLSNSAVLAETMRAGILTSFNFFGGVQAPVLQVFIFLGALFIVVNLLLSRLSRRLEIRERQRTGGHPTPRISGLEDQLAAESAG